MVDRLPEISDSEWDVMNVLWAADAPLTASEVVERLAGLRDWSPRTVKTLRTSIVTPSKSRLNDTAFRDVPRVVAAVKRQILARTPDAITKNTVAPTQAPLQGLGVRVDQ